MSSAASDCLFLPWHTFRSERVPRQSDEFYDPKRILSMSKTGRNAYAVSIAIENKKT